MVRHFLLQGIFATQGLNPHLLPYKWILEPPGVAISFFFFSFKSCPGKKKNPHHRANLQHLLVSSTIACSTLKSMTMPWGPWFRSSPLPTLHPHQSCWKARLSYATWMFAFEESSFSEWNPFCYFQKGKSLETTQQR